MNIDLTHIELPDGWTRKEIPGVGCAIEARDPAGELTVPLRVMGPHTLRLDFFTYANKRNARYGTRSDIASAA